MSEMKRCSTLKADLPIWCFGRDRSQKSGLCTTSWFGETFRNVSQRAKNGHRHEAYKRNHDDRYTREETAIEMDPTWVRNPAKMITDIWLVLGWPRWDSETGAKMSLDRIDGTKGYFLWNLRWATPSQQAANRCPSALAEAY